MPVPTEIGGDRLAPRGPTQGDAAPIFHGHARDPDPLRSLAETRGCIEFPARQRAADGRFAHFVDAVGRPCVGGIDLPPPTRTAARSPSATRCGAIIEGGA